VWIFTNLGNRYIVDQRKIYQISEMIWNMFGLLLRPNGLTSTHMLLAVNDTVPISNFQCGMQIHAFCR